MRLLKIIYRFFSLWGINIRIPYYRIKNGKRLRKGKKEFINKGGKIDSIYPIYTSFSAEAGNSTGHYFHQDLLVAKFIFEANPIRHIDIGSRIDGFVAHVASYRIIELLDIRPLEPSVHKNIQSSLLDLMGDINLIEITDSLSCLHAIEHFGLGRYGDSINPNGHLIGFINIVLLLKRNGIFYISFPVTTYKTRVLFNAHRIFNIKEILTWPGSENLTLIRFDLVDDLGNLTLDLNSFSGALEFGCGIYSFRKN